MAVSTTYSVAVQSTGDITYTQTFTSAANASGSGDIDLQTLASGANTITPPNSSSKGCLFIPPSGNVVVLTLKGVTGDTGILIHLTNPTLITVASGSTTFVINAASSVTGCRFIWF